MIKKLFSGQINSITIAALLVALSSLLSRFLGIFRDRILAGEFGASETLDMYYAAFRIPDLIFNLLILGALSAGFVPILTCLIKNTECKDAVGKNDKTNQEAWVLASGILNFLGLFIVLLSILGVIFAPSLVKILAPGFSPENKLITASLTRIMFLSTIFLGISSVLGGILQSFRRFFVYSLSPIMYNVGIIVGALFFVPIWGVYGLAWGVVMGAFLHMLVQVPAVFKLGFQYTARLDFKNVHLVKIFSMMIPRTMSLAISQINLFVITIIASTLATGTLSVFNFANNLQSFPVGIFGISFAVAAFPALSAVAFDKKKLVLNFSQTFRQIIFFIMPATVLLLTLRAQIIRVILGTGQFNWEDTILTIDSTGFFAISLFAQATLPLLVRMFYARHNSKMPFLIGLVSVVLNVFLSWRLSIDYGVAGLALAFSIASIVNFVLLWIALRVEIGDLDEIRILVSSIKFSAAAMMAGVAIQGFKIPTTDNYVMGAKLIIWPLVDMTRLWGVFVQGLFAALVGIAVYLFFCWFFRCEELFSFYYSIKRRLNWSKVETGDQGEARGI